MRWEMRYENERRTFESFSNPDINQLQLCYLKLQKQSIRKQSTKSVKVLVVLVDLVTEVFISVSQFGWVFLRSTAEQLLCWKINRRAAVASVDWGTKQSHARVVKSSGREQPWSDFCAMCSFNFPHHIRPPWSADTLVQHLIAAPSL